MSRSANKFQQKHLIALRQLALTAPGGRMSLNEAVGLLQHIVPTDNSAIFWMNKQSDVIDIHQNLDLPLAVVQDYLQNFMHTTGPNGEEASGFTIRQVVADNHRVWVGNQLCDYKQYVRSEFYNRIASPTHLARISAVPLKHADGTPQAVIVFGRLLDAPDFNPAEIDCLKQAQPWLEHLGRKDYIAATDTSYFNGEESASILIDADGKVLSTSPFALILLHQAADTPLAHKPLKQTVQGDVSVLLRRLSSSVTNAMNSQFALPPSLTINNRWGRFLLHAYVLNAFETGTPMQISLHIERKVPLSLSLFRSPRFLELTPREREVCLHSLAGLEYKEIAREMGIKPSTVIYFTRQLYRRLNIYKQSELLPALMQEAE